MTENSIRVADPPHEDHGDVSDYEAKRAHVRSDLAFFLKLHRQDSKQAREDPHRFDPHAAAIANMGIDRRRNLLRVMETGMSSRWWWRWHRHSQFNEPDWWTILKYGENRDAS